MRWSAVPLVASLLFLSFGFTAACTEDSLEGSGRRIQPSSPPSPSSSSSATVDAGVEHTASAALRRCAIGRREPTSIIDAVTRISELAPADGPCFVAALPRPLAVVATRGAISAQPADGIKSPRLFFLLPKLVVSAVPTGPGSKVLEFGEWVSPTRTIKGELALPVTEPLASDAAFTHVLGESETGTVCRVCHRSEEPHPTIAKAFISEAFQPEPGDFVTVAELAELHDACVRDDDPSERCTMLHAVFDLGRVEQGQFDPEVATFFVP